MFCGIESVDGKPSLMTFRDVETVCHELGHCLQHMLTRVDYTHVSGTSALLLIVASLH